MAPITPATVLEPMPRAADPESPRRHNYNGAWIPAAERPEVCTSGACPDTIREMARSSPIRYRPG